jgi:short-subunit dehydrogenase
MKAQKKPLHQKVIVICGASSGIGRATAHEFAKKGCSLVLAARREYLLQEVAAECIGLGAVEIRIVKADVKQVEDMQQVVKTALGINGTIDVWINNAGIGAVGKYNEIPMHIHEQVVQTSLMGHMNGTYAVLPVLKHQGYGTIINTISVGAWAPEPYAVAYTAAKYGLRGFSESLRCELRHFPEIKMCDVYPAYIDTPGFQHAANYVGKKLKPVPPVFPAEKVARTMVRLSKHPKDSAYVGFTARIFKKMNQKTPGLTRNSMSAIMENYFSRAKDAPVTEGHVLQPGPEGTGISGGWLKPQDKRLKLAGLFIAGLAGGFLLARNRMKA